MRRLALGLVALCLVAPTTGAQADGGNPNLRSRMLGFSQTYGGVFSHVVRGGDGLALLNRSGNELFVYGDHGEPYLHFRENRVVQINRHSPNAYLDQPGGREGVRVPASATPKAKPLWQTVSRNGRYTWHDHRIRWTEAGLPPQAKDSSAGRTVFDWSIPIRFAVARETIRGTLVWVGKQPPPEPSRAPQIAIGLAVVIALAGGGLLLARRRRGQAAGA